MYIANPIYDVVFKFMMEDNRVAKAFLSAIIQEEVVELDFAAQERTARIAVEKQSEKTDTEDGQTTFFTVCRLDFSAKIALAGGGFKTVLIELQKAKLASDIMRFRRYLGLHYQSPDNAYGEEKIRNARQIYCIFLLGHDIGIPERPVIRVDSCAKDVTTDEDVSVSNEFIQSLHHRSWIVQIRQLKKRRRTDLEKLLSIFDQENSVKNGHILNINEEAVPEIYRPVVRRLRMACESEDIQAEMELEDDIIMELAENERIIALKDRELAEKNKVIAEKETALVEKETALEEQKKILEEQHKIIEDLKRQLSGK